MRDVYLSLISISSNTTRTIVASVSAYPSDSILEAILILCQTKCMAHDSIQLIMHQVIYEICEQTTKMIFIRQSIIRLMVFCHSKTIFQKSGTNKYLCT